MIIRRLICLLAILANAVFAGDEIQLALDMYSSQRAWKVGDLLTVIINESSNFGKTENFSTAKSVESIQTPTLVNPSDGGRISRNISQIAIPGYAFQGQSSNQIDGTGNADSQTTFNTTFTARVVDVHDNGVLVLNGRRKVRLKTETVDMVISGLVRKRDIGANNTILSSQIADAHIVYEFDGVVTRGAFPGWFWRVFQRVNPF